MATIEEKVNELIDFIKNCMKKMNLDAEHVFLNGNCGNLYTIFDNYLKKEAVIPYEILHKGWPCHIVTKIQDDFYDITGKTSLEKYIQYVVDHRSNPLYEYNSEDFEIRQIGIEGRKYRIEQQSDMYRYDENYDESAISNEMYKLYKELEKFEDEKTK